MAHRFDADTRHDAKAFYRAGLDEKVLDGLPHLEDVENV